MPPVWIPRNLRRSSVVVMPLLWRREAPPQGGRRWNRTLIEEGRLTNPR
jgi:hypothetical protein